jgi:alkylhydroperoxidase/carboxymuconolactone decarboxylase family protein YurZ
MRWQPAKSSGTSRRQGATEEEIREVLRQVAVYAGFPSAWNALATMTAALQERQADS